MSEINNIQDETFINSETTESTITENIIPAEDSSDSKSTNTVFAENVFNYINFVKPDKDDEDLWSDVASVKIKKSKAKIIIFIVTLILLIASIFIYIISIQHGKGWFKNFFLKNQNMNFTLPIAETPELEEKYYNEDGTYTAAGIARASLPSVVQIQVFGSSAATPSGQGSGIILSDDGYIVTNAHVIKGSDYGITVVLYDRTEYAAKLVGTDDESDIAVLKIGAENLEPAQFADSDKCELGEEVVTIGAPAGYTNSVTKGIISGLDRQIRAENSVTPMSCIQIDAAINPGNSGGPLFNMWGQVIGITSSKLVSSSFDNIGFAIEINSAKPIIEQLMEDGYAPDHPRMGISYYTISEEAAKLYNVIPGLYIAEIDGDCNIAKTELKPGDIITEVNGVKTADDRVINDLLDTLKAGDKMTCKVYRPSLEENASVEDGEEFEITFKLNAMKTSMIEKE